MRLAGARRTAQEQGARPRRLGHHLVDEAAGPGERARLLGPVGPIGVERAGDELEGKAQPREQS